MLLIFLDTETTGLNPEKHRAVEIAFRVKNAFSGELLTSYESIIMQPAEIWAEADQESLKVNGMTWEKLLKGKLEKVVAAEIEQILVGCRLELTSGAFVCQNPSFDRAFFSQIIPPDVQQKYEWPYHWLDLASMYWTFRLRNRERLENFKEKDLSKDSLAAFLGLPPEIKPHRAMNGVEHLIACYEKLIAMDRSVV